VGLAVCDRSAIAGSNRWKTGIEVVKMAHYYSPTVAFGSDIHFDAETISLRYNNEV
jgi:hypothetical protein